MPANGQRGFPLSVVFLLIAVIAVLTAMLVSSLQRNTIGQKQTGFGSVSYGPAPDVDGSVLIVAFFAGMGFGTVVGGYVGWQSPRPVLGMLFGLSVGGVLGGLIATILVCPPDFKIVLSGAAMILVTAVITRLFAE